MIPKRRRGDLVVALLAVVSALALVLAGQGADASVLADPTPRADDDPELELIGRYATGLGEGSAEIAAYDRTSELLYVVNSTDPSIDVVDLADPTAPTRDRRIELDTWGVGVTSVAVHDGLAVAAVVPEDRTEVGTLVFFAADGTVVDTLAVGSLPDMVAFTPDGSTVVVANEGEPNAAYTVDPEGTVSVVDARPFAQTCPSADFSDVPADHTFAAEIGWMVERCGANGFSDGSFRPAVAVTRGAMAAFLYRFAGSPDGDSPTCTAAAFSDVSAGHPFCGEISWMVAEGITSGFTDNTFRPGQAITRQTAAAFLYRLGGAPDGADPTCAAATFSDVPVGHAFCGEIDWLVAEGVTAGFTDGTFRPTIAVSRQAMTAFLGRSVVRTVRFTDFNEGGPRHDEVSDEIRIFGPGASVAQDLEPEYIGLSADSATGWVTLQENNAVARFDVKSARVEVLAPLGFKDHRLAGNGLDASDREVSNSQGAINIAEWPVFGMYQPDALATFQVGGETFLVTANEGDARDYDGLSEESRVKDLTLDPVAFPQAATLRQDANLGRLTVTTANGDTDGDGQFEELYAYGARSFSVWDADGELVFDSGDDFEQITASLEPAFFNSDNTEANFDNRSDNKGPEPEAVATGSLDGRTFAFIGFERIGGVIVYDVTDPAAPEFVQYLSSRDFAQPAAPDSGPESIVFVPPADSPNGEALVLVSHEISGTVAVFQFGSSGPGAAQTIALAGSDTTQDLMGEVAEAYNTTPAWNPDGDVLVNVLSQEPAPHTVPADEFCEARTYHTPPTGSELVAPNGSGAGRDALRNSVQNGDGCIDVARSSSAPRALGQDLATFEYYANALDAVGWSSASANAPTDLSLTQLRGIYNCTFTDWAQVGGSAGAIQRYYPQSGSGTRSFFQSDVLGFDPTTFSSEACPAVKLTQENSGTEIADNGDVATALVPYSMANWVAQARGTQVDQRAGQTLRDLGGQSLVVFPGGVPSPNTAGPVNEANVRLNNPTPAFPGIRYVFNVVDSSHVSANRARGFVGFENLTPAANPVLSALCDGSMTALVESYGFGALDDAVSARNLPGSTCRLFTP